MQEAYFGLRIYTQAKAFRGEIPGLLCDEMAITATPVDGITNAQIIKFLAREFTLAKCKVKMVKGELSRHKVIEIDSSSKFPAIISELLPF